MIDAAPKPCRKNEMSVENYQRRSGYVDRPSSSGLADVVELILDKGLVIDIYVRVSLVGIELLTIDARIVIASVDTYLRFAEATNRLDLYEHGGKDISELQESITRGGARGKAAGTLDAAKDKTAGALESAKEKVEETVRGEDRENEPRRRSRRQER